MERLGRDLGAGHADDAEVLWQQIRFGKVIERRYDEPTRQIPCHAEQYEAAAVRTI